MTEPSDLCGRFRLRLAGSVRSIKQDVSEELVRHLLRIESCHRYVRGVRVQLLRLPDALAVARRIVRGMQYHGCHLEQSFRVNLLDVVVKHSLGVHPDIVRLECAA